MKYNERLKELRTKCGETQGQLSAAIGVSVKQIVRFEKGEQKPGLDLSLIHISEPTRP